MPIGLRFPSVIYDRTFSRILPWIIEARHLTWPAAHASATISLTRSPSEFAIEGEFEQRKTSRVAGDFIPNSKRPYALRK